MRDEVYDSIERPHDLLGRKQPHILGSFGVLKVAMQAGMPAPITVPSTKWQQGLNEDGFSQAEVMCPCGGCPKPEVGCVVGCECERYYYFAVDRVLVFNSPRAQPRTAAAS